MDIEPAKFTEVGEWDDRTAAEAAVRRCIARRAEQARIGRGR